VLPSHWVSCTARESHDRNPRESTLAYSWMLGLRQSLPILRFAFPRRTYLFSAWLQDQAFLLSRVLLPSPEARSCQGEASARKLSWDRLSQARKWKGGAWIVGSAPRCRTHIWRLNLRSEKGQWKGRCTLYLSDEDTVFKQLVTIVSGQNPDLYLEYSFRFKIFVVFSCK